MKYVIKGRRGGKTTELIKRCAEEGGYIVCMHRQAAYSIAEMARHMKLNIPLPITYEEFRGGKYHSPGIRLFHFDDADIFLQSLSPVRISTIAMTEEGENIG